jgi:dihydropteroate synthase
MMTGHFAGLPLDHPLIMGIVNVTPDSFSDGGETFDHKLAIERGFKQIQEGADIIDVGGESTRPGSVPISQEEEIKRVLPVVKALAEEGSVVSIDTRRSSVMRTALDSGAKIINDISALTQDTCSLKIAAASKASVVLMHMKGRPHSMANNAEYVNVVKEVNEYLGSRIMACLGAGIEKHRICIDPGIGFAKSPKHNFQILDNIPEFLQHSCPVMVGVSRKFGLHKASDHRLKESISLALKAVQNGISILRVHDVAATRHALDGLIAERNDMKQKFY